METAEQIAEAYCRHVRHWATITNIECRGGREIDLLAIGADPQDRYHMEVSGEGPQFGILDAPRILQKYVPKFTNQATVKTLQAYGLQEGHYQKVILHWGADDGAREAAQEHSIQIWLLPSILRELAEFAAHETAAWTNDIVRTLQLLNHAGMLRLAAGPEE